MSQLGHLAKTVAREKVTGAGLFEAVDYLHLRGDRASGYCVSVVHI